QDVARLEGRHLDLLDAHVLTPVEHGRLHLRSHEDSPRCPISTSVLPLAATIVGGWLPLAATIVGGWLPLAATIVGGWLEHHLQHARPRMGRHLDRPRRV